MSDSKPLDADAGQRRLNTDAFGDPVIHSDHADFSRNLALCRVHRAYRAGGYSIVAAHDGERPGDPLQLLRYPCLGLKLKPVSCEDAMALSPGVSNDLF